jgi:sulfur-oxidizing protein SoxZ
MADPMKIRAQVSGDIADIKILMNHPMETGRKRSESGEWIMASQPHFIQQVSITLNGKTVVEGQFGSSVSKNPFLGFRIKGAKVGDELVVSWLDNKGDQRSDKTQLVAKPS